MPKNTKVTKQQVINLKEKVMKLLPAIEQNPEYGNFRQYINDNEVVHGLNDKLEVNQTLATYMNLLASGAKRRDLRLPLPWMMKENLRDLLG